MTTNKRERILNALKDSDELATSKQLWVINDFCHKHKLDYRLPLSKYHACMIINLLRQSNDLKITKEILEKTQAEYGSKL
jgi:hypothetical protein